MNDLQKSVVSEQTALIKQYLMKQQSQEPVKPQVIEEKPVPKAEELKKPIPHLPKPQPEPVEIQAEKVQPSIVNRSNLDLPCFFIGQM